MIELLTTDEAAAHLGITRNTLYGWLDQSDRGEFAIRGEPVTIKYLQAGRKGQGRIKIGTPEVERLLSLMEVTPKKAPRRRAPTKKSD